MLPAPSEQNHIFYFTVIFSSQKSDTINIEGKEAIMETKNHLQLALDIASEKKLGKYSKYFVFGSIMPDINLFTYLRGHTYKESIKFIERKTKELTEKSVWNRKSYYDLGIILHYLADYFTFPHNTNFRGNLAEHRKYEKKLRHRFSSFLKSRRKQQWQDSITTNTVKQMFHYLDIAHQEYIATTPSVETDCNYILFITNYVIETLNNLKNKKTPPLVLE